LLSIGGLLSIVVGCCRLVGCRWLRRRRRHIRRV